MGHLKFAWLASLWALIHTPTYVIVFGQRNETSIDYTRECVSTWPFPDASLNEAENHPASGSLFIILFLPRSCVASNISRLRFLWGNNKWYFREYIEIDWPGRIQARRKHNLEPLKCRQNNQIEGVAIFKSVNSESYQKDLGCSQDFARVKQTLTKIRRSQGSRNVSPSEQAFLLI